MSNYSKNHTMRCPWCWHKWCEYAYDMNRMNRLRKKADLAQRVLNKCKHRCNHYRPITVYLT